MIKRKVQRYKNGEWTDIEMEDLKKYDVFRMFEPSGEKVWRANEFKTHTVFVAVSNAHESDGIWGVSSVGID